MTKLTDVSITLKMHLTGTAYGADATTAIIALLTAITGSKLRKRKDGLIIMKIKSKNLVSEASYFGDMVINELFFNKTTKPQKAINQAVKNTNELLSVHKIMKKSTKVNAKLEGDKVYDDFCNGSLNKIKIAQISFEKMLESPYDPVSGVILEDNEDCEKVIRKFTNDLFNFYNFAAKGYCGRLEKNKDYAFILLCKGADLK